MSERKSWELTPEQKKEFDEKYQEILEKQKKSSDSENTGEGENIGQKEREITKERESTEDDAIR